jgi:hypothetical protein
VATPQVVMNARCEVGIPFVAIVHICRYFDSDLGRCLELGAELYTVIPACCWLVRNHFGRGDH